MYFPVRSTANFFQRRQDVTRPGRSTDLAARLRSAQRGSDAARRGPSTLHPIDSLLSTIATREASLLGGLHAVASMTRRGRNQQIAKQDGEHDCWRQIVRGAARHCASRYDGQRQIIDFLLPGDVFVDATANENFAVEAIVDQTIVASFSRRDVERCAGSDPRLANDFRDLTLSGAYRLQRQILILGRASAMGEVSAFLLNMADRLSNDGSDRFELPMSRYDIANYLVMSVEMVSRSLTNLRRRGAIQFFGRRGVKIVNRTALDDEGDSDYPA